MSEREQSSLEDISGLARVAGGMWLRSIAWGVGASIRLARAAGDPRKALEMLAEVREDVRGYAREMLGVSELDDRVERLTPTGAVDGTDARNGSVPEIEALRAQGAELLRRSADVTIEEAGHPAYARILEQLAPDEARVLRLLALEGPQPSVDVRSVQLAGLGSQLVAEGLNMAGQQAGCRQPGRIAAYLNNLYRLGLIWFSKEPIDDSIAYQVLEAQPMVLDALKDTSRAKLVQRSIRLTPFGKDFCDVCLPTDTAEIEALAKPR